MPEGRTSSSDYIPLELEDDGTVRHLRRKLRFSRRQICLSIGGGVIAFCLVTLFSVGPSETIDKSSALLSDAMARLGGGETCPAHCPTDPFVKNGMMFYGPNPNDTRWLPFPREPSDALAHPLKADEVIDWTHRPPQAALDAASPQYMKMLAAGSPEVEWLRNKTVLFIGSSHDRNNINYFCEYMGTKYTMLGGHKFGYCHIKEFNFTIVNWFLYGMVDSEDDDWFSPHEERPLTFERRFDEIMLPMMKQYNLSAPQLIIETSLYWDENYFISRAKQFNQTDVFAPLTFSELIWHRSRVHALIAKTRDIFGPNIPVMFRTRHLRREGSHHKIMRIFQLDQSVRAIAEELGIKLFLWGSKLEGSDSFYDGDAHFSKGPVTWLFGDMMLFYLKRAITPGCWKCHQWRD